MARLIPAIALVLLVSFPASAEEWANKLFKSSLQHDFGAVASGSKTIHRFDMVNPFVEEIHVASVRASCGCTTPSIERQTLKTWEKGAIVAEFNTKTFQGKRGATLTVVIDKPYYAEVQLRVDGYIRSDVVFNPGDVGFGEVAAGQPRELHTRVSYAGRGDWRIRDVRSANPSFEVELNELVRTSNRVEYDMLVRLKPDAPIGYIQDQLTIVTDDQQRQALQLPVTGRVTAKLEVNPAALVLGVVEPGETVTKNLFVHGLSKFRVLEIQCSDASFAFAKPSRIADTHLIPMTFTAGKTLGELSQVITIVTDLDGGTSASCKVSAEVKEDSNSTEVAKSAR